MQAPNDTTKQETTAAPPGPDAVEIRRETARIYKAIMLAPTIEVCEALLRRERVPTSMLDPLWLERFGMRR